MFDPKAEGTNELYFATKQKQEVEKHVNLMNLNDSEIHFHASREATKDDESGGCSPPLWTKSPPRISMASDQSYAGFRVLSPTSRAQAIAKGQRELMEMVQAMPESSYELSLKDLVEYHNEKGLEKTCLVEKHEDSLVGKKSLCKKSGANAKRQESTVRKFEKRGTTILGRIESNVNGNNNNNNNKGVFLKMVFPISLGRRRRKKTKENPYAKVSKEKTGANKGNIKVAEKEWWRRRSSVSDESSGGGISSGSGSSGSSGNSGSSGSFRSNPGNSHRKKNGCLGGFTSLYSTKNNKSTK